MRDLKRKREVETGRGSRMENEVEVNDERGVEKWNEKRCPNEKKESPKNERTFLCTFII